MKMIKPQNKIRKSAARWVEKENRKEMNDRERNGGRKEDEEKKKG